MNASRGNREIDGTPGASAHSPDVGTALVNLDFNAALRKRNCEEGTGESGADERNFLEGPLHVK